MQHSRSNRPHRNPTLLSIGILSLSLASSSVVQAQSWVPSTSIPQNNGIYEAPPWVSIGGTRSANGARAWKARAAEVARARHGRFTPKARVRLNSSQSITWVTRFGTSPFQDDMVRVSGTAGASLPAPTAITTAEENGSLSTATPTNLVAGQSVTVRSTIGDGAFGATTGDFDIYRLSGLSAGQLLRARVDADPSLTPVVVIYDDSNNFYSVGFGSPALTAFRVPFAGDWFVLVAAADTFQIDLNDPGSGIGAGFTGGYDLEIGLDYFEEQQFRVVLRKGNVIGAAATGEVATVDISDRRGDLRMSSGADVIAVNGPEANPLPAGTAAAAYVVDKPGVIDIVVRATGDYELDLFAGRNPLSRERGRQKQIIFLDFDGGTFNLAETLSFFPVNQDVTLSPLSAFLPDWGLAPSDEDAVIDAIVAVVEKSLAQDIRSNGGNPRFEIEIRNSRDHADPFGQPNVSRVIVGGTIAEFTLNTIGIAGSIDIGNYETSETAYVLLDLLSGRTTSAVDLNGVARAPGVSIIDLIGVGVGEVVAHEAGHYLGNYHTDQFNPVPNIMDQGGNLEQSILGLGPDLIFGTADDVDVEFVRDVFVPSEGLSGEENTTANVAFGCFLSRR